MGQARGARVIFTAPPPFTPSPFRPMTLAMGLEWVNLARPL